MGTCLRPSWTAMVCPTISGNTVEALDHVLMTRRSWASFISVIFAMSFWSTNGPFFRDLDIAPPPGLGLAALLAASDDVLVRILVLGTRAGAERGLAPRRDRVPACGLVLALAAAVRVIDGVHG